MTMILNQPPPPPPPPAVADRAWLAQADRTLRSIRALVIILSILGALVAIGLVGLTNAISLVALPAILCGFLAIEVPIIAARAAVAAAWALRRDGDGQS